MAPFLCLHQILLELSFNIFSNQVPVIRRLNETEAEL